jgi:bifunctional non-homologous end joining protein LigD
VLVESAKRLPGDFILDGEVVENTLYAFDLLSQDGTNLTPWPYEDRFISLLNLLAAYKSPHLFHHIQMAPTASTPETKAQLLAELKAQHKEGIVFKRWDAPYTPGRPNSGGSQLKHKFYASLSAVVSQVNRQRSVEVKLMNGANWVPAGKVTIPANHLIPKVGTVVEIRYLYAFRESGALYQPTYLGQREDLETSDCQTSQLKYKAQEEAV